MNTFFLRTRVLICSLLISFILSAQVAVSTGNTPAAPSTMLDVQSTSKGFAPPRMTSNQRRAISNPVAGLIVYDTDRQTLFFFNGSLWKALIAEPTPATVAITGLDATDGAAGDALGINVDVYGNYAIAGAYRDDINSNTDQGSAYIYKFENGGWIQMQKITANDGQPTDRFGGVAIDSNYAFVGASQADINAGTDQGCVYVYRLENGVWIQRQKIVSPNAASGDLFGGFMGISNGYLAIGAPGDDVGFNNNQGAAYIFRLDSASGTWVEMQKLTANDGSSGDTFGYEVAVDNNKVIISALNDDVNGQSLRGSAYIFSLQSGVWQQTIKLTANDGASGDNFGRSITLKGDYAIVGAYAADFNFTNQGACYLFKLENGNWIQKQKFYASDPSTNSYFGTSVSISNNYVLVGAQGSTGLAGTCYLLQLNTGNNVITQVQKITPADGASNDYFGFASNIDNYNILIGAYGKNSERGKIYFKSVD